MAWVKIDDQFYAHPKLIAAGPLAKSLFVDALCYANQYLTDGFIPEIVALQISMPLEQYCDAGHEMIDILVNVGLWHKVQGGYQIHDYLDYNPSREHVMKERAAAKERMQRVRGAKPAINSSEARSPEVRPNIERTSPEVQECSPYPVPDPVPVVLSEQENTPLPPQGGNARAGLTSIDGGKGKPKRPQTKYPDDFETFWQAYPSGNGNKQRSYEQWKRIKPDAELLAEILAGLERWKQSDRWKRGFVKAAETWLKDAWWANDPPGMPTKNGVKSYDINDYTYAEWERLAYGPAHTPEELELSRQAMERLMG